MIKIKPFLSTFVISCLAALLFTSCYSSRPKANREVADPNQIEVDSQNDGILDLTLYLRRVAGVQVSGDRENARIIIRGLNSINMDVSPLFIVDGNNLGRDYSRVYSMVNIDDVARVTVLKSASETGLYGVQGANGVIEITMKQ